MTKYLDEKFSVSVGDTQQYRDNWEAIFGKKEEVAAHYIKRPRPISRIQASDWGKRLQMYFLPLNGNCLGIPMGEPNGSSITCISAYPQIMCLPKRLWIRDTDLIEIENICYGPKTMMANHGRIPAQMFKAGVWPRKPEDSDSQFGIDLTSWPPLIPGQAFSIWIKNLTHVEIPFVGCLEVLQIHH